MESSSKDHEPPVLEYARFYGLCRNYLHDQPTIASVPPLPATTLLSDLRDPSDTTPLTSSEFELPGEQLAVSREAALLLMSVLSLGQHDDDTSSVLDARGQTVGLKQEVPILWSDNELDLLEFGVSVTPPDFTNLKIPLEPVDDSKGEGWGWSPELVALPKEYDNHAKNEKLVVSKEALLYLQDSVRNLLTPGEYDHTKLEYMDRNNAGTCLTADPHTLTIIVLLNSTSNSTPGPVVTASDALHSVFTHKLLGASFGRLWINSR